MHASVWNSEVMLHGSGCCLTCYRYVEHFFGPLTISPADSYDCPKVFSEPQPLQLDAKYFHPQHMFWAYYI